MILPTKHISTEQSYLGLGALVLRHLDTARTVSATWERVRSDVGNFERFVLALDLLYAVGLVDLQDGLLKRRAP